MEPSTDADGRQLGRYRLGRELGRGAMGVVYEAVLRGPMGFRKPVALKVLRRGVAPDDGEARAALVREARMGALVSHPNVVGTYEFGEADGTSFLAMELVRGATVSRLARQAPLPPGAIVEIGLQTCAGLAHIHNLRTEWTPQGLVHQDVKPQNLLVDRTGLCKLADLGVARLGDESGAAGTFGYMAPEQLAGSPATSSDLFALGVVLYGLAAGKLPFGRGHAATGPTLACDRTVATTRFWEPVRQTVPGLDEVLASVLRQHPEDRYSSAAELAAALRALRATLPPGPSLSDLLVQHRPELAGPDAVGSTPSSTGRRRLGNLPRPEGDLVGREQDLQALTDLLRAQRRTITVVGPAGVGKSRLALAAGLHMLREFPGGVWRVDAGEARSLADLCASVASALQIPTSSPPRTVGEALRSLGPALLILDDVETAAEAARTVVPEWIGDAPELRCLSTSRRTVMKGASLLRIGPLDPDAALALFVARAPRALSADDRRQARVLCEHLDGLPLAIELAAARLRMVSMGGLVDRLEDRFRILAGGSGPERRRSLRASLDVSWELLPVPARSALTQLSVFADGFDLEAAEAVLEIGDHWALDLLGVLMEHSLVRFVDTEDRFRILATVRDYAATHLPPRDRERVESRHGAWYAQLGTPEALQALRNHGATERYQRLARERENLTVACARAVQRGDGAQATALALAACKILDLEGRYDVQRDLLGTVLGMPDAPRRADLLLERSWAIERDGDVEAAQTDIEAAALLLGPHDDGLRARVLNQRGLIATDATEFEAAEANLQEAMRLYRQIGDPGGEAVTLSNLGLLYLDRGDSERALTCFERALVLHRRTGNTRSEGIVLSNLGLVHARRDELTQGEQRLEAAIDIHRRLRNRPGEALAQLNLALIAYQRDEVLEAHRMLETALGLYRRAGNLPQQAVVLGNLGVIARGLGRPDQAEAHYQQGLEVARRYGDRKEIARILGNRGNLLLASGRWEEAEAAYAESLEVELDRGDAASAAAIRAHLPGVLYARGQLLQALEGMRRALEDPDLADEDVRLVHLDLAALSLDLGRSPEALEHARAARAAPLVEARALAAMGDGRGAVEALSTVGPGGDLGAVELACGEVARAAGRPSEARTHLASALELLSSPIETVRCRIALAAVLMDLGELDEAEEQLQILATGPRLQVPSQVACQVATARLATLRGDRDAAEVVERARAALQSIGVPPGVGLGADLP